MGLKGITLNTAPEAEPHIYAEDDAAIYQSIFGSDGVSMVGQQCKATVLSNNKVRIADGVVCIGGHFGRISYGEYEDCEIVNGQSGKKRNDMIIGKFVTTGSGGIDKMTCEVKQGVAGTTAVDPMLTQDDVYKAGKIREIPLYRVVIDGLSIVRVEQMFKLIPTIPELEKTVAELNSKFVVLKGTMNDMTGPIVLPYPPAFNVNNTYILSEMFYQDGWRNVLKNDIICLGVVLDESGIKVITRSHSAEGCPYKIVLMKI